MKLHNFIILYASLLHFIWACLLLLSSAPMMSTPVSGLSAIASTRLGMATILATVSIMAIAGAEAKKSLKSLLLLIPQQTVLFMTGLAGITAALRGHYADLTPRPGLFILADQMPAILMGFIYTLGILDKFNLLERK